MLALGIVLLSGCTPQSFEAQTSRATATEEGTVTAVVDGDTIDVTTEDGTEFRVRIIGIDTPEIDRDGGLSECYANEARTFVDELLYGQSLALVTDPSQGEVDAYDRALRHVLLDDRSVSELTIEAGYGHEYTYEAPYFNQDANRAAEQAAVAAGSDYDPTAERGGRDGADPRGDPGISSGGSRGLAGQQLDDDLHCGIRRQLHPPPEPLPMLLRG